MFSRTPAVFTLSDLQKLDPPNNRWFSENEPPALAGRCLLDTLEYLRAIPEFPGRFSQLTNAHTIRLVCHCLSDPHLNRGQVLKRMKPCIEDTCRRLRTARNESAPHYGDDFWDWAAILEAFVEVQPFCSKTVIDNATITSELGYFCASVQAKLQEGLTTGKDGEWYGPATAAIAHRVLRKFRKRFKRDVGKMLDLLRKQALEPVEEGKYRGHAVAPYQLLWHYGQVVAEFPGQDTLEQAKQIADLSSIKNGTEKSERVYALARVLQGAHEAGENSTINQAMSELYNCQNPSRPLGAGLMDDHIKGSLNVLEALWPRLESADKMKIRSMIDTLLRLHTAANTVGIVVAVDREAEAARKAFREIGARIVQQNGEISIIEHAKYRVVICKGKALVAVTDSTRTLIDGHQAKWLIMLGIAGSLGTLVKGRFRGPDKFDVVIAASIAPFRIRNKAREHIENANVPLRGKAWRIIPTDPMLFGLAHEAGDQLFGKESHRFYEGLIVTGTGIKDALAEKSKVLKEFPGGLAVEEEGYVVGLLCMVSGMPYLIVRGISDRAQGDKKKQKRNPKVEKAEQFKASLAAARVAAKVVELLSERW